MEVQAYMILALSAGAMQCSLLVVFQVVQGSPSLYFRSPMVGESHGPHELDSAAGSGDACLWEELILHVRITVGHLLARSLGMCENQMSKWVVESGIELICKAPPSEFRPAQYDDGAYIFAT